jgi:hypothetical protein
MLGSGVAMGLTVCFTVELSPGPGVGVGVCALTIWIKNAKQAETATMLRGSREPTGVLPVSNSAMLPVSLSKSKTGGLSQHVHHVHCLVALRETSLWKVVPRSHCGKYAFPGEYSIDRG